VKALSASIKVGVLFLLSAVGIYLVWKNLATNPAGDSTVTRWAKFRDASGLPIGSKVVVAGLPVGEINDLTIDGRYARVAFRMRADVKVWSGAVVFKKSTSLLGDYYLEIDPGAATDTGPDGAAIVNELLPDGAQILRVVESTSVDQLLRRIDETMPSVDDALAGMKDLTEDLRRLVNGPVASIASNVDALVQRESKNISAIIARADEIAGRIDRISRDVEAVTDGADAQVARVLDNLDAAAREARELMTVARAEVEQTGDKLQAKLDLVDEVLENTESITAKIDEDRGTLGRLVNDPTIADNVEDITEDAKGFLGTLFGLQAYVGLRSEYNVFARAARHYVSVELHTRPDKFYLIELEKGPRGDYPEVTLSYDPTDPTYPDQWVRRSTINDQTRFTFQFAKRLGWLTLRYGLKESTGGIGLDAQARWWGRDLKLSLDAFDATFDQLPRLKLAAAVEVFRFVHLLAGVDEILNPPDTLQVVTGMDDVPIQFEEFRFGRDVFFGGMVRFNDEDLAALLAVGGSALSGAAGD
jgi:phospholipid/cholesterol/gamma-HCH transport system substrate-binding protein